MPDTMTLAALSPKESIERLDAMLDDMHENVPQWTNEALVNYFGNAKPLETKLGKINATARVEILDRKDEAQGVDDKGYRYFVTKESGVKIETRVKVKLTDDAESKLRKARLLNRLPRKFDAKKAEALLQKMGVDPDEYTAPDISDKTVEPLLDQKLTEKQREAVADCIAEESISYVVKPVKPGTVKKALSD